MHKEVPMSRPAVLFLMILAPILAICLALLGLETLHDNLLGWILLALGVAYPAGGVIYYFIRREPFWEPAGSGETVREEKSDRSFWVILPGFLIVFFAPPLEWMYLPPVIPHTSGLQWIGLGLLLSCLALRIWARTHIRSLYSGHVEVKAEHKLIMSGPYRWLRHPGYTGYLLLALGFAVGYSSLVGLVAIAVLLLPGLAYRMNVEERLLAGQFGEMYREYSRRTKKIIPGIW
jgi:protein-S-isoprenylcysteine O-methyltransferase Ste14